LAGGLHGLQNHLPLPAETVEADLLPADLGSALARFERSPLVADLLGPLFCNSFAATRRAELAAYEKWLYRTITTWELSRHLEHQ
jgi:glutamine synthetase